MELALPGHRERPPLGEDAKRLRGNTLPPVSLFKAASTVSLLTLASRVTGLVRDLLMASMFGANALTDAFNVAFRIPNLFRRLFAEGAFSQAFVPVLATTKAQQGEEATRQLIAAVATVLAWILLLTCILGVLGAPVLVWALASGLRQSGEAYDAAVLMTRWMFPYIGFMSMVALSAGVLNTWKHFAVPAASPVLLNLCMIAAAWLGAPQLEARGIEPIFAMAGGVMLGGVLQLAVQVPALARLGLLPRIGVTWGAIRAAWAEPIRPREAGRRAPHQRDLGHRDPGLEEGHRHARSGRRPCLARPAPGHERREPVDPPRAVREQHERQRQHGEGAPGPSAPAALTTHRTRPRTPRPDRRSGTAPQPGRRAHAPSTRSSSRPPG